jgi:hypothetical protein
MANACLNKCLLSGRLNWWSDVSVLTLMGRLFHIFGRQRKKHEQQLVFSAGIFSSILFVDLDVRATI